MSRPAAWCAHDLLFHFMRLVCASGSVSWPHQGNSNPVGLRSADRTLTRLPCRLQHRQTADRANDDVTCDSLCRTARDIVQHALRLLRQPVSVCCPVWVAHSPAFSEWLHSHACLRINNLHTYAVPSTAASLRSPFSSRRRVLHRFAVRALQRLAPSRGSVAAN